MFYKLFFSFKIDGATNFLSRKVALEGLIFFPAQKILVYLIIVINFLTLNACLVKTFASEFAKLVILFFIFSASQRSCATSTILHNPIGQISVRKVYP